ncbi:sigma-70 family RNA polymerase sigma factor [Haliangium sp.]|uniref:sigma-70 family RNA polymerase sigma factor n=1 Tax=Haliangium sp. TaxID=2663208 RepID=UPI003D10018E
MPESAAEITALLVRWSDGDPDALPALMPAVYDGLSTIARRYLRREHGPLTLDTGALVHEAYLKLIDQDRVQWRNRSHFYAIAAQAMRRILVDDARRRHAAKRGGPLSPITLQDAVHAGPSTSAEVMALNDALDELAKIDPAKSRLVELRFFGGLTHPELAEVLGVSVSTVEREWRVARAWLYSHMSPS